LAAKVRDLLVTIGRVQCQLGQKTLAGRVAGGNLFKLVEVSGAGGGLD
jgi:hypothetical protein